MATKSRKEQIREMLVEEPNDPFLRYGLAMEFVSEGNDAEAVSWFRKLLALAESVPAYHQAGRALLRLNRASEAREVLNEGISVARKLNDVHAAEEMQGLLDGLI